MLQKQHSYVERTKNGAEDFFCWKRCFHISPEWLWNEFSETLWWIMAGTGQWHMFSVTPCTKREWQICFICFQCDRQKIYSITFQVFFLRASPFKNVPNGVFPRRICVIFQQLKCFIEHVREVIISSQKKNCFGNTLKFCQAPSLWTCTSCVASCWFIFVTLVIHTVIHHFFFMLVLFDVLVQLDKRQICLAPCKVTSSSSHQMEVTVQLWPSIKTTVCCMDKMNFLLIICHWLKETLPKILGVV